MSIANIYFFYKELEVQENQDLVPLFIRIPKDLKDKLDLVCKKKRRSQASLVQEILEEDTRIKIAEQIPTSKASNE